MTGEPMVKRVIAYIPHPDDETLSMWPLMNYLAAGYDVHFVFMSRGPVTAASLRLDPVGSHYADGVQPVCIWPEHAYLHDPMREQYELPTTEELALARLHEGMSAAGAMGMIPPTVDDQPGFVYCHDEQLGVNWGSGGAASSTAPPTEEGIAQVDVIMRRYIADYPNSLHFTMSPTDDHSDHAACGIALRRLKGSPVYHADTKTFTYTGGDPDLAPLLTNAAFFVSKLYWGTAAKPRPADVLAEYCGWYPNVYPDNTRVLARRDEYTAWLRTKVLKAYTSWCPAAGQFAIGGGHSVPTQFANCFGPQLTTVSALWHP